MRWITTQALPGIIPINGVSPLSSNPLLDPSYINGDTDTDPFSPLGTGEATWYHMSTTTSLHRARAWKARGFETMTVDGTVYMTRRVYPGDDTNLMAGQTYDGTLSMEEVPAAVSWADWVITDGPVPPPVREFPGAFGNPTGTEPFGVNYIGNVNTRASADHHLDWRSPSDGGWVEIARETVAESAFRFDPVTFDPIQVFFELVVRVWMRGNSGCLKNSEGEFFSPVRAQIEAYWECTDPEVSQGGALSTDGSDIDTLDFTWPDPASADSLWTDPAEGQPARMDCGNATFASGTGTNADVTFGDVPLKSTAGYHETTPLSGVWLQGYFEQDYNFTAPFFWTPPA